MPRGRPRKSPTEKLLEGSRAKVQVEIFAPNGAPFVPEHLPDDAQACCEFIIANFSQKHISALDSYVLAAFACAWAWHKAAVEHMQSPDFSPIETRYDKNGMERSVPNPWFRILNEQTRIMMAMAPKLFLTPSDRMVLDGANQPKSKSKFDGLLGQNGSYSLSSASSSRQVSGKAATSN